MRDRILVVDDDSMILETVSLGLENQGYEVKTCRNAREAWNYLQSEEGQEIVLLLSDLQIGSDSGLELCRQTREHLPWLPSIIMTGYASVQTAIQAMKAGVWDYLTKPIQLEELEFHAKRAIEYGRLNREVLKLRQEVKPAQDDDFIGNSLAIRELRDITTRVAATDVGVLLVGESGTGKEVVAKSIHQRSARSNGPFVAINCAALPETLLESELFGHTKGAFTDAKRARRGLFLDANGGTLFLDEIGEMPLSMQPKLLRALQERVVRPVGGDTTLPFDTRVIAATNRDLTAGIREGTFREDLYYRLNIVQIELPALRTRGSDILLLAQNFIDRFAARHRVNVRGLSPEAAEKLMAHDWPGNVRELMNAIERGVALSRGDILKVEDLPERIRDVERKHLSFAMDDLDNFVNLEELELRYIVKVLSAVSNNKSQAARILGVDRKTLMRKLKREDNDSL